MEISKFWFSSSLSSGKTGRIGLGWPVSDQGPEAPWSDGLHGLSPSKAANDDEEWVWEEKTGLLFSGRVVKLITVSIFKVSEIIWQPRFVTGINETPLDLGGATSPGW